MSTRPYQVHIITSPDSDGKLRFAVAPTKTAKIREAERSYARLAMYNAMGGPAADGSFDGTVGLPLAPPVCDGMKCPPPARVKIESNGGLQPQSVTPHPIVRTPARQASSICTSWVPPHYHRFFCAHDRFRGVPCGTCGRSTREAREWLASV